MKTILRIDASMRHNGSVSRQLLDYTLASMREREPIHIIERDLSKAPPIIDENWIGANYTDADKRTESQRAALAVSDLLISEIELADLLVIACPLYNFGVPAALKAWVDQVARAGKTFRYTDQGPVGLLDNKEALIIATSGGVETGSEIDFATPYLTHFLSFIGIHNTTVIAADKLVADADSAIIKAKQTLTNWSQQNAA